MKVHKKLAGKAYTIGDLKQFITNAEAEGFDDDTMLNPDHPTTLGEAMVNAFTKPKSGGINIFLDAVTGESEFDKPLFTHVAICPECRANIACNSDGIMPVHYRGDTEHDSAKCYGVGKRGRSVAVAKAAG